MAHEAGFQILGMLAVHVDNAEQVLDLIENDRALGGLHHLDRIGRGEQARNAAGHAHGGGIVQRMAGLLGRRPLVELGLVPGQHGRIAALNGRQLARIGRAIGPDAGDVGHVLAHAAVAQARIARGLRHGRSLGDRAEQ